MSKQVPYGQPPAYGSQNNTPQHFDTHPTSTLSGSPYPPPQAHMAQESGYAPYNKPRGYYQPGPMQYGSPQGGYYGQQQQQGYGQQQPQQQIYNDGYYGQPQPVYYGSGYGPYGRPQGQYVNDPRGPRGGGSGFAEAMLASLACCCCLDACLLF